MSTIKYIISVIQPEKLYSRVSKGGPGHWWYKEIQKTKNTETTKQKQTVKYKQSKKKEPNIKVVQGIYCIEFILFYFIFILLYFISCDVVKDICYKMST